MKKRIQTASIIRLIANTVLVTLFMLVGDHLFRTRYDRAEAWVLWMYNAGGIAVYLILLLFVRLVLKGSR